MLDAAHVPNLGQLAADAIKAAGGPLRMSKACDVKVRTVHLWKGTGIPVSQLGKAAVAAGVSPADLRPDLAAMFQPAVAA